MTSSNLIMGSGSVVIITGGASGIGLSLGQSMAMLGCKVYLIDRQKEVVEEEAKRLAEENARITAELESKRLAEENARIAEEQRLAEEAAEEAANIKEIPDLPPVDE